MDLQQGLYNPEVSNVAKETGGNLANIKTNTDTLVSGMATLTAKDFATETTLSSIKTQTDKFEFDTSNYLKVNIVAGGAGNGAILDGVDSNIKATVLDYVNSNPLAVRLTDANGDYIAAGAGTQYTEGDIDATITGTALMWEDAADTLRAVSAAKPLPISDAGGSLTVDGTFWQATQPISGDIAHDGVDSGNPVKIGHKAVLFDGSAPPNAAVAEGDRTNSISDEYGRQYVETTHPNYWSVSADYAVAQTNTSVKAAPGAGLSLYLTDIVISNGATAGNITLLNGSAGTVVYEIYPAINGGSVHSLRTPTKLTANTALCITSTVVTTHAINISGFIAP